MSKKRTAFLSFGLLAILVLPCSIGLAADPQEGALPPSHPMPVPAPRFGGIEGTSNADTSPAKNLVLPEVIWAPATGGGTWVSRLQVTALEMGTNVYAAFFWGTGNQAGYYKIFTSSEPNESVTFPNILDTIGSLYGTSLYGQVGALFLTTGNDDTHHIIADVETMNGNYGKSFPGLQSTDNTSINLLRSGMIEDISNTSTWRTGIGCWNQLAFTVSVTFYVISNTWTYVGTPFSYTLAPWQFVAFNPFTQAGLSGYSLDGYRLFINVTSTTQGSPNPSGLVVYGSKANNITNNSCALFCKQYHM